MARNVYKIIEPRWNVLIKFHMCIGFQLPLSLQLVVDKTLFGSRRCY